MREKIKKPFSVGLYKEGLRQLRVVGVLFSLFLFFAALYINFSNGLYQRRVRLECLDYVKTSMDGLEAMPAALLIFLFAALMTWMLFQFMNKRNSSDFLFAVPKTRLSIYCSYIAAIVTWVAIMIVSSLIGVLIPSAIFSDYINIQYDTVFLFALSMFCCSLQIMSVVLIAMSITGTLFSNIILSGMILIGPRFLLLLLLSAKNTIPILISWQVPSILLQNQINPITGLITTLIGISDNSYSQIFYAVAPSLYGFVLSLIYFALGAFLFQRRKSETAGKSAPSPLLQTIYRITLTMCYCITITSFIVVRYFENNEFDDVFEMIALYVIAIVIYFLFEFIATKSLRRTWKSAPGLLIIVVLNGILIGGMFTAFRQVYRFMPEAEEVTEMTLVPTDVTNNNYYNGVVCYVDYVQNSCNTNIDDPDLVDAILTNLKTDTILAQQGDAAYYNAAAGRSEYDIINVKIKTTSGTKYRHVRIDRKTEEKLADWMQTVFENDDSWRTLPTPIADSIWCVDDLGYTSSMNEEELFQSVQKELQTVDFSDWYLTNLSDEEPSFYLYYDVKRAGNDLYQFRIPIYASLYPETVEQSNYDLYITQQEDVAAAKDFVENQMSALDSGADYGITINVYYYDEETGTYQNVYMDSPSVAKEILLDDTLDQPIGLTDCYAEIGISVYYSDYDDNDDRYYGGNFRVAISSDAAADLCSVYYDRDSSESNDDSEKTVVEG